MSDSHVKKRRRTGGGASLPLSDDSEAENGEQPSPNADEVVSEDGDDDANSESQTEDARVENIPRHVVEHPAWAHSMNRLQQVVSKLATVISEDQNYVPAPIAKRLSEAENVPQSRAVRIALLGEPGTGGLLDQEGLAATGAMGSCTNVAFEFQSEGPDQSNLFEAKVVFHDQEKIKQLLLDLIDDYNHSSSDAGSLSAEEQTHSKLQSETAFDIFKMLLRGHQEYSSPLRVKDLLTLRDDKDSDQMVEEVSNWCKSRIEESGLDKPTHKFQADKAEKLYGRLAPWIAQSTHTSKPTLWPLVQRVVIRLKECQFLKCTTLIDLPGFPDSNYIRGKASEEYLERCDAVWVVAPMKRIANNTAFLHLVNKMMKQFGNDAHIICTHSEENISRTTYNEFRRSPQFFGMVELRSLMADQEQLEENNKTITKLQASLPSNSKLKRKWIETHKSYNAIHNRFWSHTKLHMIKMRVLNTIIDLRAKTHDQDFVQEPLNVFPVSNELHRKLRNDETDEYWYLDPGSTGIPTLRNHAFVMYANRVYRASMEYLNGPFLGLLDALDIWTRGAEENRKGMIPLIDAQTEVRLGKQNSALRFTLTPIKEAKRVIQGVFRSSSNVFKRTIPDKIERSPCESQLGRETILLATPTVPYQSWCEQLMEAPKKDLSPAWARMIEQERHSSETSEKATTTLLRGLAAELEVLDICSKETWNAIESSFVTQMANIQRIFKNDRELLVDAGRKIRYKTMSDGTESYIRRLMKLTFEACVDIRGPGKFKRMQATVSERLESHLTYSVMDSVRDLIAEDFRRETDIRRDKLEGQVLKVFVELKENLTATSDPGSCHAPQRHMRLQLRDLCEHARNTLTEIIYELKAAEGECNRPQQIEQFQ
ncbi:MAG: hypothetical protein M1831_003151 [Alyxoria varia]|nr:MAG: hypothetical protein M1831_003151 [Alyxoria varia]